MNIQERIAHYEEERRKLVYKNSMYNTNLSDEAYKARVRLIQAIDIELAGLYQKVS